MSPATVSASETEIRKLVEELEGQTAYLSLIRSFPDYRDRNMVEKGAFAKRGPLRHQYNILLVLTRKGMLKHDTGIDEFDPFAHCPAGQPRAGQTKAGYRGIVCYPTYDPFLPRNQFDIQPEGTASRVAKYNSTKSQIHFRLGQYRTIRIEHISYVGDANCTWKARFRAWMNAPTLAMITVQKYTGHDGYIQENCYRLAEEGWKWVYNDAVLE